jgi:hypothetical protein
MRQWWAPRDLLGVAGERVITQESSVAETVELVARELEATGGEFHG